MAGELCARLTEEFAGDRARRNDRLHEVADVRKVLDERAAAAGHVFGMTTTPTDYRTGVDYLTELAQVVLIPLSK